MSTTNTAFDQQIILITDPAQNFINIKSDIFIEKAEHYAKQGKLIYTTTDNFISLNNLGEGRGLKNFKNVLLSCVSI